MKKLKTKLNEELQKIKNKMDRGSRKNKLDKIKDKESFHDLLTDDTIDIEE
jgi:predicted  nucleic acid-binding Zn-ribbon protein